MPPPPAPAAMDHKDTASADPSDSVLPAGFRGYFIETLSSRLDALEAARLDLEAGSADAAASIRRIARSLRAATRLGFSEVARKAKAIEQTANGQFAQHLQDLMQEISTAIETSPTSPVGILVIEPDEDTAHLLKIILSAPNRRVTVSRTPAEALAAVNENAFALIILSLDLPDMDGRDLLLSLRERQMTAVVPIFLLSERNNPQLITECLALGADRFFVKPFDPSSLSSTVAARLQRQASTRSRDPLTGLPDRLAIQDAFDRVTSRCEAAGSAVSLALVTIDYYDEITDIYGTLAGEDVVRYTADLILRSLRDSDILARWTKDVFVILFSNTTEAEAAQVLDRTIQTIQHDEFVLPEQESVHIACSAGVIELNADTSTLKAAVTNATYFLYLAKAKRGGRVATMADRLPGSHPRVAIVEDDELAATILTDRLAREGYDVTHYADGNDAARQLPRTETDLVVLDVNLPGTNGFEILTRLRKEPSFRKTPILMLTAMSSERDLIRGFELGADDYVLKPFSPTELVARVQRYLDKQQ